MKILIDADACPVVRLTEEIAKERNIPVILFCDTNHVFFSSYSEVKTVSAGADAVDFAIVAGCEKGDIIITQDYGLASLVLSKKAKAIHQSGMIFTDSNIDGLLMSRYIHKKERNASAKNHLKGPPKRTKQDDEHFKRSLIRLIEQNTD